MGIFPDFLTNMAKRRCTPWTEGTREGVCMKRAPTTHNVQLQEKYEKLQKLKVVNHYRRKHSLPELAELTRCWTEAAQQALVDLQDQLRQRGQDVSTAELIGHIGIDPALVRFDADMDDFLSPETS